MKNLEEKNQRVVTFLNRDEVDYLDKIGKDALFSTGFKLSRAKLLAWMVDFVQNIQVSGNGIKSERDFKNRIMEVLVKQGSVPPATEGQKSKGGGL
jgi:hypothetical protein